MFDVIFLSIYTKWRFFSSFPTSWFAKVNQIFSQLLGIWKMYFWKIENKSSCIIDSYLQRNFYSFHFNEWGSRYEGFLFANNHNMFSPKYLWGLFWSLLWHKFYSNFRNFWKEISTHVLNGFLQHFYYWNWPISVSCWIY